MVAIVRSLSSTDAEQEEWRLRCDMAAVFRVGARLGWNEQIGNHNSLMLPRQKPDDSRKFLINPRGYLFQELTASSLIVCDLDGNVLSGKGELRKVAFHIHCRIHLQNPAATCIVTPPSHQEPTTNSQRRCGASSNTIENTESSAATVARNVPAALSISTASTPCRSEPALVASRGTSIPT